MNTVTHEHTDKSGRTFQATRENANDPWVVNYPEGGFSFYGTRAELQVKIVKVSVELSEQDKIDGE